jgi:tRNA 5-methylaminomethyl-2-thiouridine biosynthesis bifunctional protein
MKTQAIVPAVLQHTADGVPFSALYDDIYHPAAGATAQARHVFLAGNGLPGRWRGRERFVVLETGFGLGHNFLATWDAWRNDAAACARLHYIAIEQHPLSAADLQAVARDPALQPLADELAAAWPPLTPNLHRLGLDGGRVQLLLALGDVAAWLPEIVARVDAFYLDGFAPAKNPRMWEPRVLKAVGRLAARDATLATWTAARAVRDGLTAAGFEVALGAGHGGKRDITLARYAPRFVPRPLPARQARTAATGGHALIVGAGLAGCATAWALAEQGWRSTVVEQHAAAAGEASGNPGGLFHGIVNPQDGAHARFNRAAALQLERVASQLLPTGERGFGLLRLETSGLDAQAMQAQLGRLGLPPTYVQALSAARASDAAGIALPCPAWFYPGGGWLDPGAFARGLLAAAGDCAVLRPGVRVHAIRHEHARWQLLDAAGAVLEEGDALVLANAGDALRLLGGPAWPLSPVRGQISLGAAARLTPWPRLPVAGNGYLLPERGGWVAFGATSQPDDLDPSVRAADHAHNLETVARITGRVPDMDPRQLRGRTAWRFVSVDKLPIVGAVPDEAAAGLATRLDQPRFVPRVPGLFVVTGLGSRGITWSALAARVVASGVSGAPSPLEAGLLDAVDPARFLSRRARANAAR